MAKGKFSFFKGFFGGNDKIDIDTGSISGAASQISSSRSEMQKITEKMHSIIDGLEGDWDSSVCRDFKTRVGKSKEVYDAFDSILANVSAFLDQTAASYEETENANKGAADSF